MTIVSMTSGAVFRTGFFLGIGLTLGILSAVGMLLFVTRVLEIFMGGL